MTRTAEIAIVGAGLAGCEAAWQFAKRNLKVDLFEMRPLKNTPAHQTDLPAELVCSNSFKSEDVNNAHGLLKTEMTMAGSLILNCATKSRIPAGAALAVDREQFSKRVKSELLNTGRVEFINQEIVDLRGLKKQYQYVIVATGPLSSDGISKALMDLMGEDQLFFYDAIAPVITRESINMDIAFYKSRYDKGSADYINCPMNQEQYELLIESLLIAEKVPFNDFEQAKHFEGCLPIEVMASRGPSTLAFGPMKPVGLEHPETHEKYYGVLQLRQENEAGTLYNLVGCQTRMKWPEQKKVFQLIPGLEKCEFARYGSMHRNTFINAPKQLKPSLELNTIKDVYLAGQITGVEGYSESTAMGLWVALNLIQKIEEKPLLQPDSCTMIGGLVNYLKTASPENFQPMNSNFGLLAPLPAKTKIPKKIKKQKQAERAVAVWKEQLEQLGW